MDLFVNELSLHAQFGTPVELVPAIKTILGCRHLAEQHAHQLYCPRRIGQQMVTPELTFQQAVLQSRDQDLIRIVTRWIDKHGPFADDVRIHPPGEWFEHANEIVTDSTLGEVAYRIIQKLAVATISFQPSTFMHSPLTVDWKRGDDLSEIVEVVNFWLVDQFQQYCLTNRTQVTSWRDLINRLRNDCDQLTLLDSVMNGLVSEPFNLVIAKQVERLLAILNQLKTCFDAQGRMTVEGHHILADHFQGDGAKFSDESDTNKQRFQNEMTFKTPSGESIFCPYHAKISFRYYRIHFSWPVGHDEPLYVAYIGPKITRE
jgi:hypothetical protein